MSLRRRSMASMRSVASWSNFSGIGGIVCSRCGNRRGKVWKSVGDDDASHVGALFRFRVDAVWWKAERDG